MRSSVAAVFLLAVCVPAFAKDDYVVATISCPTNVYAVVNFVDKAGSDPEFHVEHDGPRVNLLPKDIVRNDQVITCYYVSQIAQSDPIFKTTYSYKVKRTIISCTLHNNTSLDCRLKP